QGREALRLRDLPCLHRRASPCGTEIRTHTPASRGTTARLWVRYPMTNLLEPVLVTGANGGIGRAVLRVAQDRGIGVVPCTRNGVPVDGVPTTACDVTSDDALASTLETHKPRIVIH